MMVIPGQISDGEQAALRLLGEKHVRPNGYAVEVGSLFGLSSSTLARAIPETATLFCVDPWDRGPWVIELVESRHANCPPFSKEAFTKFTAMHLNIVPIHGYSPQVAYGWSHEIDLYFEDANHQNPVLHNNLEFWRKHVRKGGIICGHDYAADFPDVVREVDRISAELGSKVQLEETIWWMRT